MTEHPLLVYQTMSLSTGHVYKLPGEVSCGGRMRAAFSLETGSAPVVGRAAAPAELPAHQHRRPFSCVCMHCQLQGASTGSLIWQTVYESRSHLALSTRSRVAAARAVWVPGLMVSFGNASSPMPAMRLALCAAFLRLNIRL